jgi:type IV pilus assembly protein PilV
MRNHPIRGERGMILIESLMAVAIFSLGILALIGMQATAMKQMTDARIRADASYLASQIISQMWTDRSYAVDYGYNTTTVSSCVFSGGTTSSGNANITNWIGDSTKKDSVMGALPNAQAQITVEAVTTSLVTVTLCWRAPQETETHSYTTTALISG